MSRRVLLVGFIAAAVLALAFLARAVMGIVYWSDPAHRDQSIAGWMTPRYVVMSWDAPPEVVAQALGLERDGTGRRMTIAAIAENRGVAVEDLARQVEAAVAEHRAIRGR